MARIAVVAVLTAMQLASPWLCCCTAARFVTPPHGPARAPVEPTPVEPPATPPCCCHEKQAPSEAQPEARPARPETPRPPAHPGCPCRRHSSRNAALAPEREAGKQSLIQHLSRGLLSQLALAPLDRVQAPVEACPAPDSASAVPFLPAGHILRAFHILRC